MDINKGGEKQRYELKSNELTAGTYTHSVGGNSPIPITITIITSHVNTGGSTAWRYTDTLTCTLSQAVDVNLLFMLSEPSEYGYKRYFTITAGKTSAIFEESATSNGTLSRTNGVTLVSQSVLSSKYTFTINTQYNVGSQYDHTISVEDASVDWHAMTVSGTLTRTTIAGTKPQVNVSAIEVCKPVNGESVYYHTAPQTIAANSTTTSLTNVPIVSATDGTTSFGYRLSPIVSSLVNPPNGHFIINSERAYTSLPANVTISISS